MSDILGEKMVRIIILAVLIVISTGCLDTATSGQSNAVDQSYLCTFQEAADAQKCENGKLGYFAPERWGNEQLPMLVAATFCDSNYDITFNDAGVFCVITLDRVPAELKEQ